MGTFLQIILLLILVGGIISFVGDWLGRRIGRKKLSFLGLRPRYTAIVFTVISGSLIAIITTSIILAVSQDARSALFTLEELKMSLSQRTRELSKTKDLLTDTSKELLLTEEKITQYQGSLKEIIENLGQARKEINSLEYLKNKLQNEVQKARSGHLLFNVNDQIQNVLIEKKPADPDAQIKALISQTENYLKNSGSIDTEVYVSRDVFNLAVSSLEKEKYPLVVRVLAARNTVAKETLPIKFDFLQSKLIFKQGEEIISAAISGDQPLMQIEKDLKELLKDAGVLAEKKGVLPENNAFIQSNNAELTNGAKQIKLYQKLVRVYILSKQDVYTIGPLPVTFRFLYQ